MGWSKMEETSCCLVSRLERIQDEKFLHDAVVQSNNATTSWHYSMQLVTRPLLDFDIYKSRNKTVGVYILIWLLANKCKVSKYYQMYFLTSKPSSGTHPIG